jgi:hypothetical protein
MPVNEKEKKTMKQILTGILLPSLFLCVALEGLAGQGNDTMNKLEDYQVVWDSPSKDYTGSMPLGNGEIGLNAWMEENGDLCFFIGKTDSWDDNARLLKVGKVRVSLRPNPLAPGAKFRQTLALRRGEIVIEITGAPKAGGGASKTVLHVWADANHPVVYVTAEGSEPLTATARIELWRKEPYQLPSIEASDVLTDPSKPGWNHEPTIVEPDTVLTNQQKRVGWYHHNKKSVGFELTLRMQGLLGYKVSDPILHRTFGAVITAREGKRVDDLTLSTAPSKSQRISVYVLTKHPATPEEWLMAVEGEIRAVEGIAFEKRRKAHERWWRDFWDRSWIFASEEKPSFPSMMEPSGRAVRLGLDQAEGHRFQGKMARASIFNKALSEEEIAALARGGKDAIQNAPDLAGCWTDVEPGKTLDALKEVDRSPALTLEAWVQPEGLPEGGGHIIDKATPDGSDGFLLDTWPGNSLRLITKSGILNRKDVLTAGEWHHVAATMNSATGEQKLFHNGKKVAEQAYPREGGAFLTTRGYVLQRFINACDGRGRYPIKFNGALFTVPFPGGTGKFNGATTSHGGPGDADFRLWGPGYWWQDSRLIYEGMCAAGDYEFLQPLFRMYGQEVFELSKYRTKHYFGYDGVYFPECIYFWGAVFSETYGWKPFEERGADKLQASGAHKRAWVGGLELVCLMLDYYDHTGDEKFLRERILPVAREQMVFFDNYYKAGPDGKLVMHPAQAIETWWDCTNPMTEVAGLRAITRRLLALPEKVAPAEERAYWKAFREKLPELPTREVKGVRMLAPADKFEGLGNVENPELYAVFPFREICIGRPDLELGIEALKNRLAKGSFGWRQDDIFMAYLGLAGEAKDYLIERARDSAVISQSTVELMSFSVINSRFPAFWGPNYDWKPDQSHGGVLMKAFQSMLMQTDGRAIYLLPAWPKEWNADFKLHAPYRTVVQGQVRGGRVSNLKVEPAEREKDVTVFQPG